jgi:uncharacterized protein
MTVQDSLQQKEQRLRHLLQEMKAVVVAYSGGADSSLLAAVAHQELRQRCLAVTAVSPSMTEEEQREAVEFARRLGLRHQVIHTKEVEDPSYLENSPLRCYHCRTELYTHLKPIAEAEGAWIINGANLDDSGEFRPGMKAARESGVRSPLVEAGFAKQEVRELSRRLGLSTWDKPANACLSSRVAYGTPITIEALQRVARGEAFLKSLGLGGQVRVRHHSDQIVRIEVAPEAMPALTKGGTREGIVAFFRELGYTYVTLDLVGFRSGSLNEALKKPRLSTRTPPPKFLEKQSTVPSNLSPPFLRLRSGQAPPSPIEGEGRSYPSPP